MKVFISQLVAIKVFIFIAMVVCGTSACAVNPLMHRDDAFTDGCYVHSNRPGPRLSKFKADFLYPKVWLLTQADCDQKCIDMDARFSVSMNVNLNLQPMSYYVPNPTTHVLCMCGSFGLQSGATPLADSSLCDNDTSMHYYRIKEVNSNFRSEGYSGTPIADLGACWTFDNWTGTKFTPVGCSASTDADCQRLCYENGFKYSWINKGAEDPEYEGFCHCVQNPPVLPKYGPDRGAGDQTPCEYGGRVFQVWEEPSPTPPAPVPAPTKIPFDNNQGDSLTYKTSSTKKALCSNGSVAVETEYYGHVCQIDADGTQHIRWMSMHTQNPSSAHQHHQCTWDSHDMRLWVDEWVGYCGIPPKQFPNMPTTVAALP